MLIAEVQPFAENPKVPPFSQEMVLFFKVFRAIYFMATQLTLIASYIF